MVVVSDSVIAELFQIYIFHLVVGTIVFNKMKTIRRFNILSYCEN
jgi:hypothetical protein